MHSGNQTISVRDLLTKGYDAMTKGQYNQAATIAKKLLDVEPNLAPAHFLVGLIAQNRNQADVAFKAFQSVVALDSSHAGAWAQLAHNYMKMGMVNQAEQAIQQLRRLRSDEPMVLDLMGRTLTLMGEMTLAKSCFARICNLQPDNIMFLHNLASNLIFNGETDAAEQVFERILQLNPDSPQAHWSMAGAKKAKGSNHIEVMQSLLANTSANSSGQAFYHYAIGKEFEDLQQWDKAFSAFEMGAKSKRRVTEYDEQEEIEAFNFLEQHFTKEWLNDGSEASDDSSPIFVLGQPRTGTTLIERIITAHSDVHSAGELQQFRLAIIRLGNVIGEKRFSTNTFKAALNLPPAKLGNLYLRTSGRMRGNTLRFVDKLPQNYLFLPLILKALPNAKIIHLVREPMDACFASYKQLFAETYPHSYDQEEMARHHVRYLNLMQVWRDRFGDRFLDISYEETARNLEDNARKLIDFLDLPWQDQCLEFHRQDTAVTTASAVQVREPAHTRSIGRWKRYEGQLQLMLNVLRSEGLPY